MAIIFHADDFGLSVRQSQAILARSSACGGRGALNSTSFIVTSPAFHECAQLIRPFVEQDKIKLGLHLNLVEGAPCAPIDQVPCLVNDRGVFARGFAGLLADSARWKEGSEELNQLRFEIRSQVAAFLGEFPELRTAFRVDSHQHFHLIPAVFDALLLAIKQEGCTLEYLRIPAEPAGPFLASKGMISKYPPINWVKNGLLNALWKSNRKKLPEYKEVSAVFCGLVLSGQMHYVLQGGLMRRFCTLAEQRGMDVEFLFHPGGMSQASECLDPQLEGFVDFYLSEGRRLEGEALQRLEGYR